jgi:hypothetical protein
MRMPEIHGDGGHGSHSHGGNEHHEMQMPNHGENTAKPNQETKTDQGHDDHDHSTHNH